MDKETRKLLVAISFDQVKFILDTMEASTEWEYVETEHGYKGTSYMTDEELIAHCKERHDKFMKYIKKEMKQCSKLKLKK